MKELFLELEKVFNEVFIRANTDMDDCYDSAEDFYECADMIDLLEYFEDYEYDLGGSFAAGCSKMVFIPDDGDYVIKFVKPGQTEEFNTLNALSRSYYSQYFPQLLSDLLDFEIDGYAFRCYVVEKISPTLIDENIMKEKPEFDFALEHLVTNKSDRKGLLKIINKYDLGHDLHNENWMVMNRRIIIVDLN